MSDRPDARSVNARRLDPKGKSALFEAPVQAPPDHLRGGVEDGKRALYSAEARRPGTVVVECSGCKEKTRSTYFDLGLGLLPVTAWIPGRKNGHLLRCPACNRRRWCSIGFTD